jgi:hypothetical protein
MLVVMVGIGLLPMCFERVARERVLPKVPGWWGRVALLDAAQLSSRHFARFRVPALHARNKDGGRVGRFRDPDAIPGSIASWCVF